MKKVMKDIFLKLIFNILKSYITSIKIYLFYQNFIESYKSKSDERYVDVDVPYPERLYELQNELPFLSERIKIEKVEKLVVDLYDRK